MSENNAPTPVTPKSGWQPIETAPRDGTMILGYDGVGNYENNDYQIMFYSNEHNSDIDYLDIRDGYRWFGNQRSQYGYLYAYKPTHWHSLPKFEAPHA